MAVSIASELMARLQGLAAASPDREVCGLLLGAAPGRIEAVLPAANVAPDPASRFELDPAALFAALRAERGGGARILGHYHSHPRGPASPSMCDAAAADGSGTLWLILAGGEARLWRAMPGGPVVGAFEELALTVDGDAVAQGDASRQKGVVLEHPKDL